MAFEHPSEHAGASRGPLRHLILSATGQDVRRCANCQFCEDLVKPGMDLSFGELMRAASRDDPVALTNDTLWACDGVLESSLQCQADLDIPAIIDVLRREAKLRGLGGGRALH
jgi:Fe-S oxidoreductase